MPWTIKKAILIKISFNTSLSDIAFSSYKAKSRDCAEPEVLNFEGGGGQTKSMCWWGDRVGLRVLQSLHFIVLKFSFFSSKVLSKREISLSIFVYY